MYGGEKWTFDGGARKDSLAWGEGEELIEAI